jgi:hypothetical protein
MTKWKKSLLVSIAEILVLLLLHAELIRIMADRQIVSTILATNGTISLTTLALALVFLVVRFLVVLALPGMILARFGLMTIDRFLRAREEKE